MKFHFFSKKNLLDEMQEQKMSKIESRGCHVFFFGLLAALVIQTAMGAGTAQVAGEWIVLMGVSLYMLIENIRNGLWDRHLSATSGTNLLCSLAAAAVVGGFTFARNGYWPGALCTAVFSGILCFAALQWSMLLTQKRRKDLDNNEEDEEDE